MNSVRTKPQVGRWLTAMLTLGLMLALAAVPVMAERPAAPDAGNGTMVRVLERVGDALKALEAELSGKTAPAAERLEENVEALIERLEAMLKRFEEGDLDPRDPEVRKGIVEIDLRMHRLVYRLGEAAEAGPRVGPATRGLDRMVERLETFLFRLDGILLEQADRQT